MVKDDEAVCGSFPWKYRSAAQLARLSDQVMLEGGWREALIRINPEIGANPVLAEEVIYKLRANEEFHAWLTELFLETKTDQTPAVVERIVNDIDAIVKVVRYDGWQDATQVQKAVQKALRQSLLKYNLQKDDELLDRAYGYIREYY